MKPCGRNKPTSSSTKIDFKSALLSAQPIPVLVAARPSRHPAVERRTYHPPNIIITMADQGKVVVTDQGHAVVFSNESNDGDTKEGDSRRCTGFEGNRTAKGAAWNASGRGAVIASNIFISTALLYLASEEAGCLDDEGKITTCDAKIYGFLPSSLITNIAVISGLISAVVNPVIGAIVDYTDYRHAMGASAALLIIAIQAVQIYTVSSTWFPMAILQAIAGFLYQVMITATYAYLPELSVEVGEKKMENLSPKFTMVQFAVQALFMVVIIGINIPLAGGPVLTGHISQGICVAVILLCWGLGWFKFFPKVQSKRKLEGRSLWKAGFTQLYHTSKHINHHYKRSIRWYFLALCFAEAGANAFTVCAVTYLNEVIKMSATEVGIVFLIVLVCTIPGAKFSEFVARKTNFNSSWRLNMLYFSITTAIGVFILKDESSKQLTFFMGCLWGIALGWFYPMENGFFAVLVPQEQATEMAGLYNFCSLIISWVPPFIFTAMNESGVPLNFGLLHIVAYFVVAILLLSLMPSYDEAIKEAHALHANQDEEANKAENGVEQAVGE